VQTDTNERFRVY